MVRFYCAPPPLRGKKGSGSWYDRWEKFRNSVRHALSRPGGSVTRTTHHLVFGSAFGRPPSFACAIHMYTPVGGKAPSVPLGASPCSPWEPEGAAPARWCGARVRVCLLVVCRIVTCLAGYVAGVSVPQCGVWRLGWLGSCFGVWAFCPARLAGLGVTPPCSPARAGGLADPVWRAHGPLRAPGGGPEKRNTGQCPSPPLAP